MGYQFIISMKPVSLSLSTEPYPTDYIYRFPASMCTRDILLANQGPEGHAGRDCGQLQDQPGQLAVPSTRPAISCREI